MILHSMMCERHGRVHSWYDEVAGSEVLLSHDPRCHLLVEDGEHCGIVLTHRLDEIPRREPSTRDREPTPEEIKAANDCPMCDAFGICPSHQWLHDWSKTQEIGKQEESNGSG